MTANQNPPAFKPLDDITTVFAQNKNNRYCLLLWTLI